MTDSSTSPVPPKEIEEAIEVAEWRTKRIGIHTQAGALLREEEGLVHELCPGLAVTMHQFGVFDVTHIASGQIVCGGYERCASACLSLAELSFCADWTQSREEVRDAWKAHGDEPANVPGVGPTLTRKNLLDMKRNPFIAKEFPWEGDEGPGYKCEELLQEIARRIAASTEDQPVSGRLR